jgi:hypothetical protein
MKGKNRMSKQERSTAVQRLDAFVGKWKVELVFPGEPPFKAETDASFEWLDAEQFFLVYRAGTPGMSAPVAHCVIGADDTMDGYTMLYSDSRGVARLYQMSIQDGVWKQWRDDPSFYQRFSATFSEDGNTITGSWENSEDGVNWNHDFALSYIRVNE